MFYIFFIKNKKKIKKLWDFCGWVFTTIHPPPSTLHLFIIIS